MSISYVVILQVTDRPVFWLYCRKYTDIYSGSFAGNMFFSPPTDKNIQTYFQEEIYSPIFWFFWRKYNI
jgi:hypothetical protein